MTTDPVPGRFQLSLVENSLDFFLSAAEYAARDDPISWKYSILHLADGVELLFKARLEREHWSLLFADINQASLEKLERGDFKSVDFEDTCRRLRQIAFVKTDERESEQLNELRRLRNKIRHYTAELNSRQLRAIFWVCMSICIRFCAAEGLSDAADRLGKINNVLEEGLDRNIDQGLVKLVDQYGLAWHCPDCWLPWVVFDNKATCKFCLRDQDPVLVARHNAMGYPVPDCPECFKKETLARFNIVRADGNIEVNWICLSCGRHVANS